VKLRDFAVFEVLEDYERKRAFREAVGEVAHMVSSYIILYYFKLA
jgi:hypothetical protein